jgi:hypothetical protein
MSLTFHKTNVLHSNLKKDGINEFEIKYWISKPVLVNFRNIGAPFTWILKKMHDYGEKILRLLAGIGWFQWNQNEKNRPLCLVLVGHDIYSVLIFTILTVDNERLSQQNTYCYRPLTTAFIKLINIRSCCKSSYM